MAAIEVDTPGSFLLYGLFSGIFFFLTIIFGRCFAAFGGVPVTDTQEPPPHPPGPPGNGPAREGNGQGRAGIGRER